jgi:LCP family protein required for cell wall assembly
VVAAVVAVLLVATVTTVVVLVHRYDASVHKAKLLDDRSRAHSDQGLVGVSGPLNYLLLGSDQRPGDNSDGQRSDTIILVHIPASLDKAYLISIPRDLQVDIPPNPATHFAGSTEKINAAFDYGGGGMGGFQLLSRTLTSLTGVRFDGAAIIDFTGFQQVVNLLGGVDMCVDEQVTSIHTGAVYQPGCQHMRPWQALDYVRQRETLPGGDYDRQRHQQQFLKAILAEAKSQGLTTNPVKLDELIRAVGSSLTVDTNGVPLSSLVYSLHGISANDLVGVRLPSDPGDENGISYVFAEPAAQSLYQAITSDTVDSWLAANPTWRNAL